MARLVAITLLFFATFDLYATAYPLHLRALGWGAGATGVAVGALMAAAVACRPFLGEASDRRGPRAVLLLGLLAFAAAAPLLAVADRPAEVVPLRAVQGLGFAAVVVATQHLAAALGGARTGGARAGGRGRALAWQGTGDAAGLVVGPLLGERAYAALGPEAFFAMAAVLPLFALVLALRLPATGAGAVPAGAAAEPHAAAGVPGEVSRRSRNLAAACAVGAAVGLPLGAVLGFFALRAAEAGWGWPAVHVAVGALALIAGRWVAGLRYDAGRAAGLPALGLALAAAGGVALALPLPPVAAAAALALIGAGFGLAHTALLAAVAEWGGARPGRALAWLANAVDLGGVAGTLGLAPVAGLLGSAPALGLAGAAALVGLPPAVRVRAWWPRCAGAADPTAQG